MFGTGLRTKRDKKSVKENPSISLTLLIKQLLNKNTQ